MSDIVKARELILIALQSVEGALRDLEAARNMMTRKSPIKRTRPKRVIIDERMRLRVRNLASLGKSNHDIAEIVGLANGGRVSEILNGKR